MNTTGLNDVRIFRGDKISKCLKLLPVPPDVSWTALDRVDDSDDEFPIDLDLSDEDSQELILGEEPPVTNAFRNTPVTRYESWSCDESEYCCDVLVTLNGPGMRRHDIRLGTLYWFCWRSNLGRGRFHTRFVLCSVL